MSPKCKTPHFFYTSLVFLGIEFGIRGHYDPSRLWSAGSQHADQSAPTYLSRLMVRVADLPGRRSVHSARSGRLLVPSIRLSTVGLPCCRPVYLEQSDRHCDFSAYSLCILLSPLAFARHLKNHLFDWD